MPNRISLSQEQQLAARNLQVKMYASSFRSAAARDNMEKQRQAAQASQDEANKHHADLYALLQEYVKGLNLDPDTTEIDLETLELVVPDAKEGSSQEAAAESAS